MNKLNLASPSLPNLTALQWDALVPIRRNIAFPLWALETPELWTSRLPYDKANLTARCAQAECVLYGLAPDAWLEVMLVKVGKLILKSGIMNEFLEEILFLVKKKRVVSETILTIKNYRMNAQLQNLDNLAWLLHILEYLAKAVYKQTYESALQLIWHLEEILDPQEVYHTPLVNGETITTRGPSVEEKMLNKLMTALENYADWSQL